MSFTFQRNQDKKLNELGASPILVFAIGWENKVKEGLINQLLEKRNEADLDLSCAVYDQYNDRIDCVWYGQLKSKEGAIRHRGDDTIGWHEGDDEIVIIDLNQLDEQAKTLFFVISSFAGDSFSEVEDAYWRLFDAHSKREIARYDFRRGDKAQAKIVMRLQKMETDGLTEWVVRALDENATGHNIQEVFPEIRSLIEA